MTKSRADFAIRARSHELGTTFYPGTMSCLEVRFFVFSCAGTGTRIFAKFIEYSLTLN